MQGRATMSRWKVIILLLIILSNIDSKSPTFLGEEICEGKCELDFWAIKSKCEHFESNLIASCLGGHKCCEIVKVSEILPATHVERNLYDNEKHSWQHLHP
jgi:hypothetical protein